jgi:hypothetical protein
MRRVIAIAVTGLGLAGCSSFSMDYFKSAPAPVQLQLDSVPPGAEARTSIGPSCKTPCSVSLTPPEGGFTVSYTLNKFQPATVQVLGSSGDFFTASTMKIDPNPVVAELQPVVPPKAARSPMRPKKPKKPATAPPAAGAASPDPGQAPPPLR